MSTDNTPLYFVVERRNGVESAALYHDQIPYRLTGKGAEHRGLAYALRLDVLGGAWTRLPLAELFGIYRRLRDEGRLPPSNIGQRKVAA